MATESTTATLTLVKGPLTFTIQGMTFRQNEPVPIAINHQNAKIIERLKIDPNFRYEGPSKKKPKKASQPPPPAPEDEGEEVDEEEEESNEDEPEEPETEEKATAHTSESLRGLKKKELLRIAKTLKIKKLDPNLSRSAIADAILEAQG